MKRPLLPLLFAGLAMFAFAPPSFAQYTNGGNDESTEDFTVAGSWAATAVATPGTVAGTVTGTHLLITEVGMRGLNSATLTDSTEFIEIYNPTGSTIDLSKFYVSDVNGYSALPVAGTIDLVTNNTDFAFRFPAGSSIAPGAVKVIAIDGGRYKRGTGVDADFELFNAGGGPTTAQIMTDVGTNKAAGYPSFGSFTNSGEFVWLFFWSGACDLTVDVDLAYWPAVPAAGANAPVRKLTTTCQDGPDAGAATSCYFNDAGNPAGSFGKGLSVPASGAGTRQRAGAETETILTGGNGIAPLAATSTTVASDNNPSSFGTKVNFTAAVSPASASGSVQFFDGASSLGSAPVVAGSATISVSTLSVGSHVITAVYGGDCAFAASTSLPLKQNVNAVIIPTTTTLNQSSATTTCGEKLTLTATVAPPGATGTVTFYDGANPIGTGLLDAFGNATLSVSNLASGVHSLTAVYGGDSNHSGSTSPPVSHQVDPAISTTTLTQSVATTNCGEKFTITATVTGNPTGDVEFFDGATSLAIITVDGNGQATLSISTLGLGSHSLTAHYHSDPCNSKSDSNKLLHDVNAIATTLTLTSSPNPSQCGEKVVFTATVDPATATGEVNFFDRYIAPGAPAHPPVQIGSATLTNGEATLSVVLGGVGPHDIIAGYKGDACHFPSPGEGLTQDVNALPTSITLTSDLNPAACGDKVNLTATVDPAAATGTVNFFADGNPIGSATLDNGVAVLSVSLGAGSYSLTAAYQSSGCYAASTSNKLVQVVDLIPTSLTLTSSPNPSACAGKVVLEATLNAPTASGEVNFFDGAAQIGVGYVSNGVATLSTYFFTTGSHSLTATYKGDGCYAPGTSNKVDHVVDSNPTTTTLTSAPNPSFSTEKVTLTATVAPDSAVGEVNFFDGANQIGSGMLTLGVAVLSVPGFTVGSHSLTAVYKGNGCQGSSVSNKVVQVVDDATPVQLSLFRSTPVSGGIELRWQFNDRQSIATVVMERSQAESGPWNVVDAELRAEGEVTVAVDRGAEAGRTYFYRLVATSTDGRVNVFGPVVETAGAGITEFALAKVSPNPSPGATGVDFTVARSAQVRLSVIDLMGREVGLLASGSYAPGRYHAVWSGQTERGPAPAGLYFIRYQVPGKNIMGRIVLTR